LEKDCVENNIVVAESEVLVYGR